MVEIRLVFRTNLLRWRYVWFFELISYGGDTFGFSEQISRDGDMFGTLTVIYPGGDRFVVFNSSPAAERRLLF